MQNAKRIIVIALIAAAWIGIRFDLRRTLRRSPTDIPLDSSSDQARRVQPPAADRSPKVDVGSEVPNQQVRGRGEDSHERPSAGRPEMSTRKTEQASRSPVPLEPRPVAPAEPARSAIEPEAPREARAAPPQPDREPVLTPLELPRGLDAPTPSPAPPVATSVRPPGTSPQLELASVQRVLGRYEEMYDRLDAGIAASIWPRMDARALAKVFARLKQQSLNFDGCAVAVAESRATAHCTGWLTYVPRVGNDTPRREHHSWTIEFERTGGEWRILEVGAK